MIRAHEIDRYRRDGVVHPLPLLSKAEAVACRKEFWGIEQASGEPLLRFDWAHLFFAWAYDLSTHSDLLDTMEALLGPDIVIWGTLITHKPAGSDFHFAWHQDSVFCPFLDRARAATAWIALTESTLMNGCLRVLPGSHRRELAHAIVESDDNILRQKQRIAAPVDEVGCEDVVLRAGEMSVQDMALVHSSGANRSGAERVGFIVRFATPAIKSTSYPLIRAKGCRGCGHLTYWERPANKDLEQGLREREALLATLNRDR